MAMLEQRGGTESDEEKTGGEDRRDYSLFRSSKAGENSSSFKEEYVLGRKEFKVENNQKYKG